MRHTVIALFTFMLAGWLTSSAWNVPDETLQYSVRFKWGLIDANVGIAKLQTYNIPSTGRFIATLSGKSIDLLGHYYAASDTIVGSIMSDAVKINSTQRIDREHGEFAIETVTGSATARSNVGPEIGQLPDGQYIHSRVSNYGSGLTIDLLSVFYYIRQIDYGHYIEGQDFHIDITNGTQVEALDITYTGKEDLGQLGEAYHISLTFTAQGTGKSDAMQVWISTAETRIPLIIDGSLSVGHIECHFLEADPLETSPRTTD